MKNQALFASKDKSKILKCFLLQFLFGTLRVKAPKMKIVESANSTEPDKVAQRKAKIVCNRVKPSSTG